MWLLHLSHRGTLPCRRERKNIEIRLKKKHNTPEKLPNTLENAPEKYTPENDTMFPNPILFDGSIQKLISFEVSSISAVFVTTRIDTKTSVFFSTYSGLEKSEVGGIFWGSGNIHHQTCGNRSRNMQKCVKTSKNSKFSRLRRPKEHKRTRKPSF